MTRFFAVASVAARFFAVASVAARFFAVASVAALSLVLALPAAAQAPGGKPSNLQPVPEPPPPPPGLELDPALEPQVTILKRGTDTVEEYRIGGKLYMQKITPARGVPYYLVDRMGDGKFIRDDSVAGNNIRPPMWLLFSW